jgi:glycerol uptake facilitator-like aquaporin
LLITRPKSSLLAVPRLLITGGCGVGAAAVAAGTFLPWLRSGTVSRDSYRAGDALRRIGELPSGVGVLFDVWPFVPLACALTVAAALLGRIRPAAVVATVVAAVAGATAGGVLAAGTDSLIRPATSGPAVVLAGSGVILATVLIAIVVVQRARTRPVAVARTPGRTR